MKNSEGFTLIELMIVVSIIGILASVSLPAYQDYVYRAKIAEAIMITSELKPQVVSYFRTKNRFPDNNLQAGVPEPQFIIGNYVKQVSIEKGAIHVELGNKAGPAMDGKILTLRPIVVDGSPQSPISWICGDDLPPDGMSAVGDNKTTLESEQLPSACRA